MIHSFTPPQLALGLPVECMAPRCEDRAVVRVELGEYVGYYCARCRPSATTIAELGLFYALAVKVVEL